jgi:glycosyltransferase involved in cell wall biosynthesis
MTLVTAIIPVFNRAATVSSAIDSALSQELPGGVNLDVVVVDDGSSDALDKTLGNFGPRVVCLRHERNRGAAAARNTGIEAAKGEFVAFLDSDDIWLPSKTAVQLSEMRAKQWLASCTAFSLHRSSAQEYVSPFYAAGSLGISDLVWGCFVSPGSTLICRRSVFSEIGMFDASLRRLEDWDWLLRLARQYVLGFIAEPLARISASEHRAASDVFDALETICSNHSRTLSDKDRSCFLAGIDFERAAALKRSGSRLAAVALLLRSILRSPFRHAALTATIHNKTRKIIARCKKSNAF